MRLLAIDQLNLGKRLGKIIILALEKLAPICAFLKINKIDNEMTFKGNSIETIKCFHFYQGDF